MVRYCLQDAYSERYATPHEPIIVRYLTGMHGARQNFCVLPAHMHMSCSCHLGISLLAMWTLCEQPAYTLCWPFPTNEQY